MMKSVPLTDSEIRSVMTLKIEEEEEEEEEEEDVHSTIKCLTLNPSAIRHVADQIVHLHHHFR